MFMLLAVLWSCNGTAQPDIDIVMAAEPSRAQALMDKINPAEAATTCRLVIEGGTNKTEMDMYGTSIARAQLACSGTVMRIAVHPVLAPFAGSFTGVNVSRIPSMRDFERAEDEATDDCFANRGYILYLCGQPRVAFLQPHIVYLASAPNESTGKEDLQSVMELNENGVVSMVDPFMSQLQFAVLSMFGAYLNVKGGVINATKGIGGNGVMLFDGTRFTNNQNLNSGGAVTLVMGHAVFRDFDFTGNQANKASDSMHTDDALAESLISGFGGAVFARIVSRGNDTLPMQTSATFLNCTFTNNMASQGGAIALVGVNASITNCTFRDNIATRRGVDVFSIDGGALDITGSNITVASPTVVWERLNGSQCLRGEVFDTLEGACRRCAPSTYSLVTPAPTKCLACPGNAQVCNCKVSRYVTGVGKWSLPCILQIPGVEAKLVLCLCFDCALLR